MVEFLTRRKQKWIAQRKNTDTVMRGSPIKPPIPVEVRYRNEMLYLIDRMADDTKRILDRLYDSETAEEYFTEDASMSSKARKAMNELYKKYLPLFQRKAKLIAQ